MEIKEKNTKDKILEEALKLFAQSGYMGTSMNDIASKLGVTSCERTINVYGSFVFRNAGRCRKSQPDST